MNSGRRITWSVLAAIVCLIVVTSFSEVGAQQNGARPSLADRLSALRRSITGEELAEPEEETPARTSRSQNTNHRSARAGSRSVTARHSSVPQQRSVNHGAASRNSNNHSATGRKSSFNLDPLNILPFGSKKTKPAATNSTTNHRNAQPTRPTAPRNIRLGALPQRQSQTQRSVSVARRSPPLRVKEATSDLTDLTQENFTPPVISNSPSLIVSDSNTEVVKPLPASNEYDVATDQNDLSVTIQDSVENVAEAELGATASGDYAPTDRSRNTPLNPFQRDTSERSATERSILTSPTTHETSVEAKLARRSPLLLNEESAAVKNEPITPIRTAPKQVTVEPVRTIPQATSRLDIFAKEEPIQPAIIPKTSLPKATAKPLINSLFIKMAPAVSATLVGPKNVMIGREANYKLILKNQGEAAANGIVTQLHLPTTVKLISSNETSGFTQNASDGSLEWQINQLGSRETATLNMTIRSLEGKPFTVGINMQTTSLQGEATIVVEEPQLALSLQGPSDVLFGDSHTYRLQVSNPGTGLAENIVLTLIPPGGTVDQKESVRIAQLPAGKTETFDIELSAMEVGNMQVQATAVADGGLTAASEKLVVVRKPELHIDIRGPKEAYANTTATYYFRVRNDGTAEANGVIVSAKLPAGAKLAQATEGYKLGENGESVSWKVGKLSPGDRFVMEMRCSVTKAGDSKMIVATKAEGKTENIEEAFLTNVVALADLKLEISDPRGPVAVGSEAEYTIRLKNRGSNTAKSIQIVALFSEGVEPIAVEGGKSTINNGRIAFQTIDSMAAGSEIVFKIRAIAGKPGALIFRAEVLCSELETKLSQEETTRFFDNDFNQSNPLQDAE